MQSPIDKRASALAEITHDYAVMFPCEPDQFREFISGLLGKPQTIERVLAGPFDVSRDDISNIHHLLNQRISAQNDGTLVAFCATISYDDDSSVSINSFDDFVSYAEIRPLISESINISWTYLVKFKTSKVPEKQQIDLTFSSGFDEDSYTVIRGRNLVESPISGSMRMRVNHTNRSWGSDIDAMISGHLGGLKKSESKIRVYLSDNAGKAGFIVFALLASILVYATGRIGKAIELFYNGRSAAIDGANIESYERISRKTDLLMEIVGSGVWTTFGYFASIVFIASIGVSAFAGVLIESNFRLRRPSFILITPRSMDERGRQLKALSNDWLKYVVTLVVAVLVGVVGNYIFYVLTKAMLT